MSTLTSLESAGNPFNYSQEAKSTHLEAIKSLLVELAKVPDSYSDMLAAKFCKYDVTKMEINLISRGLGLIFLSHRIDESDMIEFLTV